LKDADYLVIVLSRASVSSRWVEEELNAALSNQISGKGVVLPVLLEDCELPMLLRDRLYADFRTDFNAGLQALVAALEQEGELAIDVASLGPATSVAPPLSPDRLRENLQRLLSDRMTRAEIGRLWYAVLETGMDDEMGQRQKSDYVIELLLQAKNRDKLPRLIEELRKIRPDLVDGRSFPVESSATIAPNEVGSLPRQLEDDSTSELSGHGRTPQRNIPSTNPKVFISYSHDSPGHRQLVLALSERLRIDGVDSQLDQYIAGTPEEGWPRWMLNQLDWAEFVLVICTQTYYRRFRGIEQPDKGKGADWEGSIITLEIYESRSRTKKFVPILFDPQNEEFIPEPLSGHTKYLLHSETNYAKLYDFLTGQAGVVPAQLGPLKTRTRKAIEPLRFG
jgi:hypothetical protein